MQKRAASTVRVERDFDTAHPTLPGRRGVNARLQYFRLRAAAVLRAVLGPWKQEAAAAMLGVSRARMLQWFDDELVHRKPAPLAMLWTLDDSTFDEVVAAIRESRKERWR